MIFKSWLVGFSEGDGSFILPKNNKKCFEIWQHINDINLLYLIRDNIGLGNIRVSPYRPNIAVFYINKKEELVTLSKLFETKICTLNTKHRFDKIFLTNIILNKPSLNDAWLSGFIDAEGCFRLKIEKTGSLKIIFEISQNDEQILLNIKEILNITSNLTKNKNTWKLSIYSKENRESLIKYLEQYPLKSHKQFAYEKWKEINNLVNNKENLPQNIKEISKELNQWRVKSK
jgi:hypothetical protein